MVLDPLAVYAVVVLYVIIAFRKIKTSEQHLANVVLFDTLNFSIKKNVGKQV